jgi:L-fucose/D-arabinose isomerase
MKKNTPTNRLRGQLPKVGIRPTIDGRYGGVRESLEDSTMAMAQRTADLIKANIKHACGLDVRV